MQFILLIIYLSLFHQSHQAHPADSEAVDVYPKGENGQWSKPGWGKPGWGKPGWGKPGWGKPEGEHSEEPEPEGESRPEGEPEPEPEPENCLSQYNSGIGKSENEPYHNIPISEIYEIRQEFRSELKCGNKSTISHLSQYWRRPNEFTCNGVITCTNQKEHVTATFRSKNGKDTKERLIIYQYSSIEYYNMGNILVEECGIIGDSKCQGDFYYAQSIYKAQDQDGCRLKGRPNRVRAVVRDVHISGKCASKCELGTSSIRYGPGNDHNEEDDFDVKEENGLQLENEGKDE